MKLNEHEHDWGPSDFLVSMDDPYDGPIYRYRKLDICKGCGVLRPAGWVPPMAKTVMGDAAAVPVEPEETQ